VRSTETKYQCDNCKRVAYNPKPPTGWSQLKIWRDDEDEPEPKDICDSCSQALAAILGRRKSIERGSYREGPMQEHPKSPEACDADARAIAARASKPAAN
jgi:hypothetical protein